jgi:hypothetical protein
VLTFWPYVWQLDPRHIYDEHLVLALKLDVTLPPLARGWATQYHCTTRPLARQVGRPHHASASSGHWLGCSAGQARSIGHALGCPFRSASTRPCTITVEVSEFSVNYRISFAKFWLLMYLQFNFSINVYFRNYYYNWVFSNLFQVWNSYVWLKFAIEIIKFLA